jgi:UDP-N-acetyl-D-mannosaminuronic acid dehydrogenase
MNVAIYGLGYIGLPTAALVASSGIKVIGIDNNQNIIDKINKGEIINFEENLEEIVLKVIQNGSLNVTDEPSSADTYIITVPTPANSENIPDLSYVEQVSKTIAPLLNKGNMIILESTLPVGGTTKVIEWILEERSDLKIPLISSKSKQETDINIAYCPERVLPGNILKELINNDRIIGGLTKSCSDKAHSFYKSFILGDCLKTNIKTAELSKLVENSYRDVNIAFANELSLICEEEGVNVWELIKLANRHPRVDILQPGPGVGGHCIAIDPWFIVNNNPELSNLIKMARLVNDSIPGKVVEKVNRYIDHCGKSKEEITIAILGLAYKANVDDIRESPALEIVRQINKLEIFQQLIVEPNIDNIPLEFKDTKTKICSIDNAIEQSDIVLLLVDHKEFYDLDKKIFIGKQIIDTKGILGINEQ